MKYNKLVRDKIPNIIKNKGQVPIIYTASNGEYWKKLKEKLEEEINEFLKSENQEEIADVLEVINAICNFKKFKKIKIEVIRKNKLKERGGFKDKIILQEVK